VALVEYLVAYAVANLLIGLEGACAFMILKVRYPAVNEVIGFSFYWWVVKVKCVDFGVGVGMGGGGGGAD